MRESKRDVQGVFFMSLKEFLQLSIENVLVKRQIQQLVKIKVCKKNVGNNAKRASNSLSLKSTKLNELKQIWLIN